MTFTFIFTQQELETIAQALGQGPHYIVAPILANIQKQVDEQVKPKDA